MSVRAARFFGIGNLIAAVVLLFGVFVALPTRWAPVDLTALLIASSLGAAGTGLLARTRWAEDAARIASWIILGIGLLLVATLALTASYLNGVYGPVGQGGAIILICVAALALPYLVILPCAQLVWLGPRKSQRGEMPLPGPKEKAAARAEVARP